MYDLYVPIDFMNAMHEKIKCIISGVLSVFLTYIVVRRLICHGVPTILLGLILPKSEGIFNELKCINN